MLYLRRKYHLGPMRIVWYLERYQDIELSDATVSRIGMRRFGGDCYAYGLLASGHVGLVLEMSLQPYDYMALVPVVEGAGGVITDWNGKALGLGSDGRVLAAASAALHAEALNAMS